MGVGDVAVGERAYLPLPLLPLSLLASGVGVDVAVEPELLDRSSEPPERPEPSDPELVPDVAEPEPLPSEPLPDEPLPDEPLPDLLSSEPCEPDEPEPLVPSPEPEPGASEPRLLSSEPDEPEVPGWSPASWLARPSGPPELGPPELWPPASFDGLGETAGTGCL